MSPDHPWMWWPWGGMWIFANGNILDLLAFEMEDSI